MNKVIDCFDDEYAFLSNFYEHKFSYNAQTFATSEHAFQAAKCVNASEAEWIRAANTPGIAKRRGRQVSLRGDWELVKDQIMYDILIAKFSDPELKAKLIATGDAELVEGNNWHDNYWGVCSCGTVRCADKIGRNMLGKTLMRIRSELSDK